MLRLKKLRLALRKSDITGRYMKLLTALAAYSGIFVQSQRYSYYIDSLPILHTNFKC